jgi:hypothetical protein
MATVDLIYPGASPEQLIRGLAAAGDILRNCRYSIEQLKVVWDLRDTLRRGEPADWRFDALLVCEEVQAAAFAACADGSAPPDAMLVIKVGAPLD